MDSLQVLRTLIHGSGLTLAIRYVLYFVQLRIAKVKPLPCIKVRSTCRLSIPTLFEPDHPYYAPIAACVDGADEVCKTYPKAYELAIKAQLFLMFHILFSQCCTAEAPLKNRKSLEKMKLIIKYVENNYMEKISIADMAKEAGLSQSHFMKFFKNTMGTFFH